MQVLGLLLRVGCVFALLFAVLHVLKRTDGLKSRRTGLLQVVGSTRLAKGATVTVVRMGDAEYLLGVTDHNVTLLTSQAAAQTPAPAAVETAAPVAPSPAEFLRNAYRVARRLPAESTEVSADAVTAALASVQPDRPAEAVVLPLPRTSSETRTPSTPRTAPARVPDGSATPTSRHALRRAVARTDALRHEEQLWTRSCRPTSRTSDLDGPSR